MWLLLLLALAEPAERIPAPEHERAAYRAALESADRGMRRLERDAVTVPLGKAGRIELLRVPATTSPEWQRISGGRDFFVYGDGAAETFKSVSDAVESCSGGFPVTMQGTDQKVTGIAAEKGSGSGDESVGFTAKSDAEDGDVATTHVEVVRHGSTIATYYTMNLGLMITDKPYDVPAAVIDAQSAKLK